MELEEIRKHKKEAEKAMAAIVKDFLEKTNVELTDIRYRENQAKLENGFVFEKEYNIYLDCKI